MAASARTDGETRSASCSCSVRYRAQPPQLTPLDARTDGTYSTAGTAERSAKSCGTPVATKVITRVPSGPALSAARGAPARTSSATGRPAGAISVSSLRAIGASNDWK